MSDKPEFYLSQEDKNTLLHTARTTIEQYIRKSNIPKLDDKKFSDNLMTPAGAFVTLHEKW